MNFTVLFELLLELLVLGLQGLEFVLAHVEVVDEPPDAVSPEDLLDDGGLVIKVRQAFAVNVLALHLAVAFAGVEGPEVGLDGDGSGLHAEKLLAFDVHLEHGLNLEGSGVVPFAVLLALVGPDVVDLLDRPQQHAFLRRQFH